MAPVPSGPLTDEELRRVAVDVATRVAADSRCTRTADVLVARSGRTLLHQHTGATRLHDLFSVTKTVLALLAGLAVGDGRLSVDDPVTARVPAHVARPELEGQTVAHLLTTTRGAATGGRFDLDEVAVSGGSWAARFAAAPRRETPGTRFRYDNGASQLLAEVLHQATGDLAAYAGDRLLTPLGVTDWTWRRDPTGTPAGPGHLSLAAPDLARVGTLLCDEGRWQGERLVDPAWVQTMRTPVSAGGPPEGRPYGAGLWVEDDQVCFGAGWAGQLLLCRPSDGLVVVSQSDPGFDYGPPASDTMPPDWRAPLALIREHLLEIGRTSP
jgi:CubicO group peptidase (beta-lactamase class C family)